MTERILEVHLIVNWAQFFKDHMFAVKYAGDTATGTPDTWQLWTREQLLRAGLEV